MKKRVLSLILVLVLCLGVLSFGALGSSEEAEEDEEILQAIEDMIADEDPVPTEEDPVAETPIPAEETADPVTETPAPEEPVEEEDPEEPETDGAAADSALKLTSVNWQKSGNYYYIKAVYCTNAVNSTYQYMYIYVPAAYITGGSVNGYTANTAPIILENRCEGWKSSTPGSANSTYLNAGYVYVSCGARSRDAENGTGKSPAAVVDLKAAVRWLRLNDDVIPGNSERIISIGSSGGGQMSSILGASGNMSQYYPYLYEIGAAGITKNADGTYASTIDDNIYGCMCSCPIADIDNADIAYAWFFMDNISTQNAFQKQLVQDLAYAYGEYINGMGLVSADGVNLTFDYNADGTLNLRSGTYYDQILQNISDALNAWLENGGYASSSSSSGGGPGAPGGSSSSGTSYSSADAYIASLGNTSRWLEKNADGTYSVTDLDEYATAMSYRSMKGLLGFDTWTASAEGDAFGTASESGVHFSASVAAVLEENYAYYSTLSGFSQYKSYVDSFIQQANRADIQEQVYLMNATAIMLNVANGTESADVAPYWRIRTGTSDSDTTYNVSYGLAATAAMAGADVDYSLIWLVAHGGNEGSTTGTFSNWVQTITAKNNASLGSTTPSYSGTGGSVTPTPTPEPTPTPTPAPPLTPTGIAGDVNADGTVDVSDVQTLLKHVNGQQYVAVAEEACDCNGDGEVTITDVQILLKYVNKQNVTIV